MTTTPKPTLNYELDAKQRGYLCIAGVDEAGRGSIFGPVCVGMVVLSLDDPLATAEVLDEVRDSKKLLRTKVYRLADVVKDNARAWGVGDSSANEVDQHGIVNCIRMAAERALLKLEEHFPVQVDYLLTDSTLPAPARFSQSEQESHVGGDIHCLSIACAAILAKQYHDEIVREIAQDYDDAYQLQHNVGYGTAAHRAAIQLLGPTPDHRHSFRPIAQPPLPLKEK